MYICSFSLLSIKLDEADQLVKLETCRSDIKTYFSQNVLILHSNKTKVIIVGPSELRGQFVMIKFLES